MNKKCVYTPLVLVCLACLFLTACYSNYYGIYHIGASPSFEKNTASAEDNKKIYEVIKDVALEYGFFQDKEDQYDQAANATFGKESVSFGKGSATKGKHENLEGSEGPFSIILYMGSSPEIMIRDWKRTKESEFIKSFKNELEKRLAEVLNMEGVEFYRKYPLYW